jgi:hypothetical protein
MMTADLTQVGGCSIIWIKTAVFLLEMFVIFHWMVVGIIMYAKSLVSLTAINRKIQGSSNL